MTKFPNDIKLGPYEALAAVLSALPQNAPTPTTELGTAAGLSDPDGLVGALRMMEVQGVVHELRGKRNQLCWLAGPRTGKRPKTLAPLLPYERVAKLLQWFGQTPIATDAVLHDVGLNPAKTKDRERVLGALKALTAFGLVEWGRHSDQAITWRWRSASAARPYAAGHFGNFRHPLRVSDDALVRNSRGRPIGTVDEVISYTEYEQDQWGDL